MPLYEYKCKMCGARFEAITRITEADATECPDCGAPAERQMSSFALGTAVTTGKSKTCFTGG